MRQAKAPSYRAHCSNKIGKIDFLTLQERLANTVNIRRVEFDLHQCRGIESAAKIQLLTSEPSDNCQLPSFQEASCMYTHILIPTDGSELSKMAIQEGVALAKALAARVTVITVTRPFHVFASDPGMITDTPEQYRKRTEALAGQYLDAAKDIAATAGVPCDVVHVVHEQPYRAIIDTAQSRGCDAIEMASHGRRGISAILLGSETLKVLTHSTIPVIVARRPHLGTLFQESFAS